MTKQLINTPNNNDTNNTQQKNSAVAQTASTSDQEFLTFLSTIDLPDEGVFANNKDNYTSTILKNGNQFQVKSLAKIQATLSEQPNVSQTPIASVPFPYNQQINDSNNDKAVPMKVDGNMYIQSFLPAGVQSYQQPDTEMNPDALRKKKIRNLRDQQRSQSINNQITELRQLLQENGQKFEKTDKYSTLDTVMQYLKDAQNRITVLETEYERYSKSADKKSSILSHPEVNYFALFHQSPIAQATVSLDGKFIDVNEEFESLTGFTRDELLTPNNKSLHDNEDDRSLFHILDTPETVKLVCKAMSRLIECSDNGSSEKDGSNEGNSSFSGKDSDHRFWQGDICSKKNPDMNLQMTITLARSNEIDVPLLFQCTFSKK